MRHSAVIDSTRRRLRQDAETIFRAGLSAVDPAAAIRRHVRREGNTLFVANAAYTLASRRVFVIAFGKAAVPMSRALAEILQNFLAGGIAVTKYGHALAEAIPGIEIYESAHPVPDSAGAHAAQKVLALAEQARKQDLVIVAISGGGSALLPLPYGQISLAEKQAITTLLLQCGATIREVNTVRKHLSAVKGGRLAAAIAPATCCNLVLSDVIGDPVEYIASGPTVPDSTTFFDAWEICGRYHLLDRLPSAVVRHLQAGIQGEIAETPKPQAPMFRQVTTVIVGNIQQALTASTAQAKNLGYNTMILTTRLQGEAREIAHFYAAMAQDVRHNNLPIASPACILSGGEPTVAIRGTGKGGRNQELALAVLPGLDGNTCSVFLAAGTDGTDGPTDAAGAFVDDNSRNRAQKQNLDWRAALDNNDAYPFFAGLEDLFITGPTRTNVMDLYILLVEKC